jgi:ferredoxin
VAGEAAGEKEVDVMAMKIVDGCIACGACEPDCPNTAITAADPLFIIEAAKCTECVGAHDAPKCIEVCPVSDCIIPDPDFMETKEQLQAKYASLH